LAKSRKNIEKRKKEVSEFEKERGRLISNLLIENGELIEGSYQELLVKCMKPECKCQEKPFHPVTRISWYENGKIKKHKIVRVEDRERVKKGTRLYQDFKLALSSLVKLNEKEKKALQQILKSKLKKYV
jgi:hypothetical protein